MIAVGKVNIGMRRSKNEDSVFVSNESVGPLPNLYIVADGMGGHKAGAIASKLAIDAFCDYIEGHKSNSLGSEENLILLLKRGILHANYVIYNKGLENPDYTGMGTTITLCTVIDGNAYIAHVGDTRLYCMNSNQIKQVTVDHSLVQEMLEQGMITQNDAQEHPQRHVITRAVGTYEQVKVDTLKQSLNGVEYMLLCSDGLTSMMSEETIHKLIYASYSDIEGTIDHLIEKANEAGGVDNIAVIIVKKGEVNTTC
ncbi:Stp1/IreP family PP2C-type Ser/Thr phosphatase [Niameybacter massiliensis]|uniref:Stp1/IreP family PP2C-type Ser/Thr phosphatase n=1 Tax=Holtiella tumoricola TaxID=3018743 RepID=A0AA42DQP6_9FIRM|nr:MULTISPECIES: Stp1/IreP family PP2C-type Ser/Thr phosphatase [Lachnospirales]MDA3733108.1 Stp1/IreP family PP2C-type Ser/Thr phosphatase [Holtiella tumoricola]